MNNINKLFIIFFFIIFITLFYLSNVIGGHTWDELQHLNDINFFFKNISNINYETVRGGIYYGILPIIFVKILFFIENQNFILHLTSFFYFLCSVILIFKLFNFIFYSESKLTKYLILFFYTNIPLIIGHSFFNYKDMVLLFYFLLSVYSVLYLYKRKEGPNKNYKFIILFSIASLGMMGSRFPAFIFLLPHLVMIICYIIENDIFRSFILKNLFKIIIINFIILTLLYPGSWSYLLKNPFLFYYENIIFFGDKQWSGCYILFGNCYNPFYVEDYSAFKYYIKTSFLKLPLYIILFFIISLFFAFIKKDKILIFLISCVFFTLSLIFIKNSTLFDGLRHTLFLIPIFFVISVYILNFFGKKKKRNILIITTVLNIIILYDNIKLYPYNYIYFNELNRANLSANYQTNDYWGFSLKEASKFLNSYENQYNFSNYISADPWHLINPFLEKNFKNFSFSDNKEIKKFYILRYSRSNKKIPKYCNKIFSNKKQLLFTHSVYELSYIFKCEKF